MRLLAYLLLASITSLITSLATASERNFSTPAGDDIPVDVYAAGGDRLLLWLPSEFGAAPRRDVVFEQIAERGVEVWAPDLHAAWFLPAGRYSLNDIDPVAITHLIDAALGASSKDVYLVAEGRTTALALSAARQWQLNNDDTARLKGVLSLSPKLFVRTPQGAEVAEYLPIAAASNLPIYVIQPEDSAAFWRIADVLRELQQGGASVYLRRLPGVADGFHSRPDHTPAEAATAARLPAMLDNAMTLLAEHGGTPPGPAPLRGGTHAPQRPTGDTLLRPFPGERKAPPLRLATLNGETRDLADLRDKVVLVNFWTTWCPPCVEEIPSLQRLYRRLRPRGLEILAVDVGESRETMRAFLADKPIDFPVLIDTDGEALRRWGIYAFPTTLVVDRAQHIRFAVFGAFDWNSDDVVDALSPLLAQ